MTAFLKKTSAFFVIGLAIFLFLALFDYHPEDPSLFHATDRGVQNITSSLGAKLADPMLQAFGYSLLVPLAFTVFFAIRYILGKDTSYLAFKVTLLFLTWPLTALIFAGLDGNNIGDGSYYNFNWGGYLGYFIRSELYYTNFEFKIFLLATAILVMTFAFLSGFLEFLLAKRAKKDIFTPLYQKIVPSKEAELPSEEKFPFNFSFVKEKETVKVKEEKFFCAEDTFDLPPLDLLHTKPIEEELISEDEQEDNKSQLLKVLNDFGVRGEIIDFFHGPVVTLYALEPVPGTKSSRVIGLADDIARSMKATSARISILQGRNAIGIEIPNKMRSVINFKDIITSPQFQKSDFQLPLAIGTTITGEKVVVDLAKMPHLLVAGTTGSGKSVGLHSMILSLLYKYGPETCKFLLVDPKRLEFSIYGDLPHLVTPVVTDPDKAIASLQWAVEEMGARYRAMSLLGVRNIFSYNKIIAEAQKDLTKLNKEVQTGFDPITREPIFESILINREKLPYIVVIIDEMADLMLVAGKEIESSVQRLAQMARAAGIHLIMSTQRPSVDVITGVIKANLPTRISFQVASKIDSRTILGEMGAEQLLGAGDLLYMMPGGKIERLHGAMVEDEDIESIVQYWKDKSNRKYLYLDD